MLRLHLWLVPLLTLASLRVPTLARAGDMDLVLSRLSQGDCGATSGAGALVLSRDGAPTLTPDGLAFRELVSQLGSAIAPTVLTPVITSGPIGMGVSLETTVTKIDSGADFWQRATRGRDRAALDTCAGRNTNVRSSLVTNRVRFEKGLPFGLTLGAQVGLVHATGLYLVGADLKLALLEEVWHSRVPDLALRASLTKLVGARDLALYVTTVDALISESFVVREALEVSPFAGAGALWTRADTRAVDLTPNIDAQSCRVGADPVCNAAGLGASGDDLAHEVKFPRVSQLRYRAFVGLWLRYRQGALSSSMTFDTGSPHVGERGHGATVARQWTLNVAPSVIF
ncbi:MAG: hypothetical protein JWN48_1290 [Myxococcaceae bacterium]|nr:hypothetical protein [Myxococcaceae bacterium]